MFIDPLLQKHKVSLVVAPKVQCTDDFTIVKYDLRFVLVHDGLYGRNHLYSYVKSKGKWWKTVDHDVTEVSVRLL